MVRLDGDVVTRLDKFARREAGGIALDYFLGEVLRGAALDCCEGSAGDVSSGGAEDCVLLSADELGGVVGEAELL